MTCFDPTMRDQLTRPSASKLTSSGQNSCAALFAADDRYSATTAAFCEFGYPTCDMTRMQPFWVSGHDAHPSFKCADSQCVASWWCRCCSSSSAMSTLTSSSARTRQTPIWSRRRLTSSSVTILLPRGNGKNPAVVFFDAIVEEIAEDLPVNASRSSTEAARPADVLLRAAICLSAATRSSSISRVVRMGAEKVM